MGERRDDEASPRQSDRGVDVPSEGPSSPVRHHHQRQRRPDQGPCDNGILIVEPELLVSRSPLRRIPDPDLCPIGHARMVETHYTRSRMCEAGQHGHQEQEQG